MASGDVNNLFGGGPMPKLECGLLRCEDNHNHGRGTGTACLLTPSAPRNNLMYNDDLLSTDKKNLAPSNKHNEMTSQVYFFLLQMKLLNTLDLVRAVCKPWGIYPHGNDYVYHFNQIATAKSVAILRKYEMIFSVVYDGFEQCLNLDSPSNLWTRVKDVDYFKVIYHLECLRMNYPFDNVKYIELLENTLKNLELLENQQRTKSNNDLSPQVNLNTCNEEEEDDSHNFDEVPIFTNYNWQSRTHSYSLSGSGDLDNELNEGETCIEDYTLLPLLTKSFDDDQEILDSDLVETCTNTIDLQDNNYDEEIMASIDNQAILDYSTTTSTDYGIDNTNDPINEDFNKIVMDVLNRRVLDRKSNTETATSSSINSLKKSKRKTKHGVRQIQQSAKGSYSAMHNGTNIYSKRSSYIYEDTSRKRHKRRSRSLDTNYSINNEIGAYSTRMSNTNQLHPTNSTNGANVTMDDTPRGAICLPVSTGLNVVSASVSYDKRQQRFMAQWKTREGTKHSKSFYAKRYSSPLMARKHAELYKMYILQHRGKGPQEMTEPTYEQLAAQDFQPLEQITITDVGFMDEFD